jgi:hypothetical protein
MNVSTLSPIGNLLAIGARMRSEHDKGTLTPWSTAKIAGRVPLDQPLLRASSQITETVRDPERSLGKFLAGEAYSFVPFSGAVRGIGETIDTADKRYPDSSFKEQFQRNVPKWRESLPASRARLLGAKQTKAVTEVERLGLKIQATTRKPDESVKDFEERKARISPYIRKTLEAIVELPKYQKETDANKIEWLKQGIEAGRQEGEAQEKVKPKIEKKEKQFPIPSGKSPLGNVRLRTRRNPFAERFMTNRPSQSV